MKIREFCEKQKRKMHYLQMIHFGTIKKIIFVNKFFTEGMYKHQRTRLLLAIHRKIRIVLNPNPDVF